MLADDMRQLASDLLRQADALDHRRAEQPLAIDVLQQLAPRARLHASKAMDGPWWAYLVLPTGVRPDRRDRRAGWIYNEGQNEWWTDESGETEDEAIRKALHVLVDTKVLSGADDDD